MNDHYKLAALVHSQHIADIVSKEIHNAGWDVHIKVTSYDSAVDDARELIDAGFEAILCHGGFREAVFKAFSSQTVVIERSSIDIVKSLLKARAVTHEVGVAAHIDEAHDFGFMETLLDMKIHPVIYTTKKELEEKVQILIHSDIRFFVGGGGTARMVNALGGRTFLDEPQPQNIIHALQRAVAMARSVRKDNVYQANINAILGHLEEGVLCISSKGAVVFRNAQADKLLKLKNDADIAHFIETLDINSVIQSGIPQLERIVAFNDLRLLTNCLPIQIATTGRSVVCFVQDVRALQKINRKIEHNLLSRGFVTTYSLNDIKGTSPGIALIKQDIAKYAPTDIPIYIHGETGTGKELVAHALHSLGNRAKKPFIVVNCASLPDTLLESELFGYEEGAFTGAKRGGKVGLFEMANGGTLFFDEIGDISPAMQVRLLRVLDAKEIMRVGGDRFTPVDVRVICASHQNLLHLVTEGRFRMDLYFRLAGGTLRVPPLRERLDDIPLLIAGLLQRHGKADAAPQLSAILRTYDWPGNVRELLATVESYLALAAYIADPPEAYFSAIFSSRNILSPKSAKTSTLKERLAAHRDSILQEALTRHNGNLKHVAQELGVSYSHLRRLLRPDGLEGEE